MRTDFFKVNRKNFLKLTGLTGIGFLGSYLGITRLFNRNKSDFPVKISGANFKSGHLLRTGISNVPKNSIELKTAIIGGGISGLSAGWYLNKNNHNNFLIFELDSKVGGNSSSGENNTSKYPYGAHYVPLPGNNANYVKEFFEEVGIITGYKDNLPIYNEFYLCADPSERLFFQGHWQEGLIPDRGIQKSDRKEYDEFFSLIKYFKGKIGKDNKPYFTIPLEFCSQDKDILLLDKISMYEYMKSKGWNSSHLHWFVNYACRDDYGTSHKNVSAWAGLHYYASRTGKAANVESSTVLAWPEGNGFLVNKLRELSEQQIKTNSLVYNIEKNKSNSYYVDVLNTKDNSTLRYIVKNVIYSSPRYTAPKVIRGFKSHELDSLEYFPWLVANITLKKRPTGLGASLSWDNVNYYSRSLGYIVANHQDLTTLRNEIVITYYLPLDETDSKSERIRAYKRSKNNWLDIILPDLEKFHTGITNDIIEVDLWIWGHGMISPGINYIWNEKRNLMLKAFNGIEFAHSDMSGISIFEEAQYRGCEAAKKILARA